MLTYIKVFFEDNQDLIKMFVDTSCLNVIEMLSFFIMIITIHSSWFYIMSVVFTYTILVSFFISLTIQKKRSKSSAKELSCIRYLRKEYNLYIQSDDNVGQKRILTYQVDGFEQYLNLVIDFNGCYYHGHGCNDHNSNLEKLDRTINRENDIRAEGYNVISIWECQWDNKDEIKFKQVYDDIEELKSKQSYCMRIYNNVHFAYYYITTIIVYFCRILMLFPSLLTALIKYICKILLLSCNLSIW